MVGGGNGVGMGTVGCYQTKGLLGSVSDTGQGASL